MLQSYVTNASHTPVTVQDNNGMGFPNDQVYTYCSVANKDTSYRPTEEIW